MQRYFVTRLSMCIWRQVGEGGRMETMNFLCLLSTNIIIEKIFVFLWFWFMFLTLSSLVNFLYYAMLLFSRNDNIRKVDISYSTVTQDTIHPIKQ